MAIEELNDANDQLLIKSQQNDLKQRIEQFARRYTLINSIWNTAELPEEWKERSVYLFIRSVVIIKAYHFCPRHKKFYPTS
jgi:hypothetical protein